MRFGVLGKWLQLDIIQTDGAVGVAGAMYNQKVTISGTKTNIKEFTLRKLYVVYILPFLHEYLYPAKKTAVCCSPQYVVNAVQAPYKRKCKKKCVDLRRA